jgi:hypothetical protein
MERLFRRLAKSNFKKIGIIPVVLFAGIGVTGVVTYWCMLFKSIGEDLIKKIK